MDTKAAFEKWCTNQCNYRLTKGAGGNYLSMRTRQAYSVWQAYCAAIEIDLDNVGYMQVEEGTFYLDERDVEKAITSHGIRIKGKTE